MSRSSIILNSSQKMDTSVKNSQSYFLLLNFSSPTIPTLLFAEKASRIVFWNESILPILASWKSRLVSRKQMVRKFFSCSRSFHCRPVVYHRLEDMTISDYTRLSNIWRLLILERPRLRTMNSMIGEVYQYCRLFKHTVLLWSTKRVWSEPELCHIPVADTLFQSNSICSWIKDRRVPQSARCFQPEYHLSAVRIALHGVLKDLFLTTGPLVGWWEKDRNNMV